MKLENIKRGQVVQLSIPASRPIKTLNGVLHEAGQDYKILGTHGTCVRLSRVSDKAKLIVTPETVFLKNPVVLFFPVSKVFIVLVGDTGYKSTNRVDKATRFENYAEADKAKRERHIFNTVTVLLKGGVPS